MPTFVTRCKQCGQEFEPDPQAIRAGSWRLCADCAPKPAEQGRCRDCGRPLVGKRDLCLSCLGAPAL